MAISVVGGRIGTGTPQRQTWMRKRHAFTPVLVGTPVLANGGRFLVAVRQGIQTSCSGICWRFGLVRPIEASTARALETNRHAFVGSIPGNKPGDHCVARTAPSSPGRIPHRLPERAVAHRAWRRLRRLGAIGASMRGNLDSALVPRIRARYRTPAHPPKKRILVHSPCRQASCRRLTFPHSFARATRAGAA